MTENNNIAEKELHFQWKSETDQYIAPINNRYSLGVYLNHINYANTTFDVVLCLYERINDQFFKKSNPDVYRPIALSNKPNDYPIFNKIFPLHLWPHPIAITNDKTKSINKNRTPHKDVQHIINTLIHRYVYNTLDTIADEFYKSYEDKDRMDQQLQFMKKVISAMETAQQFRMEDNKELREEKE